MMSKSQYIKYDKPNKLWIQHRKVVYLYWFKFLQHAERGDRYTVDWTKYQSWGGCEVVMETKFDDWWKDYWKDLFAFAEGQPTNAPFYTKKKPEVIAMRTTLLVYGMRDIGDKWDVGCAVARNEHNKGRPLASSLQGEKDYPVNIWQLKFEGKKLIRDANWIENPDDVYNTPNFKQLKSDDVEQLSDELYLNRLLKRRVQGYISRYFKQADELMFNISKGSLDAPD
ncbi:hypothetical protein NYF23_12860 [SAR92 clade bacterium H455]|uniref:Uncharacterized protein n=1 Tax=SAR92 clade bacterium H455 TaxID=2974818 RepID=A0ABY5TRF8_9GAMM|nr:hypothetical protein NYF23_12860 [SAR92 clade bacterium H455]